MSEAWKPLPGWESYYFVSTMGRVLSVTRTVAWCGMARRQPGRIIKPGLNSSGYPTVNLCRDGTRYTARVHRLVLEAFVGPCPPGLEACHVNDIKCDNRLENLYWGTHSANTYDTVRNGNHPMANKTHCPAGHPYDEENTYVKVRRNGGINRLCWECTRAQDRGYKQAHRARKRAA